MGINLGGITGLGGNNVNALNLKKNDVLNLTKKIQDLQK